MVDPYTEVTKTESDAVGGGAVPGDNVVTVKFEAPTIPFRLAITRDGPAITPVTSPDELTVALLFKVLQVCVEGSEEELPSENNP